MAIYDPVQYIGDGTATDFIVPWPYVSTSSISVKVNGSLATISLWVSASKLRLSSAPAAGAKVVIYNDILPETYDPYDDFGVVGDGIAIDTTALNNMFAAIRASSNAASIDLRGMKMVVTNDLNVTSIRNGLAVWGGEFVWQGPSTGRLLDLTDSFVTQWRGTRITSSSSYPLTSAVLQARRNSDLRVASKHHFDGMVVDVFATGPAWHNFASEVCRYNFVQVFNRVDTGGRGLAIDGNNTLGASSQYQTIANAGALSNTIFTLDGVDVRMTGSSNGAPLYFGGYQGVELKNCYAAVNGDHVVEIDLNNGALFQVLDLDLHCEGAHNYTVNFLVGANKGTIGVKNLLVRDHNPRAVNGLFSTDASGTSRVNIEHLNVVLGGNNTYAVGMFDTPASYSVKDGTTIGPSAMMPNPGQGFVSLICKTIATDRSPIIIEYREFNNGVSSAGAVTLNGMQGVITTESLSTAASSTYTLTHTNNCVAANDTVRLWVVGGGNSGGIVHIDKCVAAAGSVVYTIRNIGASAFNNTLKLGYEVIKRNV
jgi:hypothetical protein